LKGGVVVNYKIKEKLLTLPLVPGVYIMKDSDGNIIYVGKSKVLKNRVSQYFQSSAAHTPKTLAMVSNVDDFEYIVTDTEAEALALECNLIKKHRPKYNILLKDDKQYPYITITTEEDFPRLFMTRTLKKDKNIYFGPFMTALNVRESVEEIRKIFKIRSCNKPISEDNPEQRPCLYYQIGQCSAPCCGKISKKEYFKKVNEISAVLNGNYIRIVNSLKEKMQIASDNMEFEKAAQLRDKIMHIKALSEKQKISSTTNGNMDFIAIYKEDENYCIQILYYRNGSAVGSEYFTLENEKSSINYVLESYVKQFYFTQNKIPKEIYLSEEIEDKESIEVWLGENCGHKVSFIVPKRGNKAEIMKMVLKNAQESLYKDQFLKNRNESYQNRMLAQLKELLSLNAVPARIEAYDISNFSGASSIGVEIVYKNASPAKALYRKFNIKTVEGSDDYESMREVIARRINEAYKEEDMIAKGELMPDKAKFLPLPDLILLDGGKGHVNAIKPLINTFGEDIAIYGLVKDDSHKTRGVTDGEKEYILDKKSELFKFLMGIQEEVHRFAITATRRKHEKSNISSELENITGIGPQLRKKLLLHFGGIKKIKLATKEELSKVVNEKLAERIFEYFKSKG